MKSVYLNNTKKIGSVYTAETLEYLKSAAGLEPIAYSHEDVAADSQSFANVEYVFSTWGMPVFTTEEVKNWFPSLKAIFYAAGTVQYFAKPFLENGVKVFSAWAANAIPVAEYTVAQIILANKGFYQSSRIAKTGDRKSASKFSQSCPGNYGAKIGIIGAGMIGKLVINMLKSYHLEVLVFDPFLPDEKAIELGDKKVSLETLFKECQVVSNHLANNAETQGMLKYEHFASMKPYATFLNTGRGAQVVEDDLVKALTERPDLTAVLDVTFPEPPEQGHAFYTLSNCILTPHIAGSMSDEVHRMSEYMVEEFDSFKNGRPTRYEVTLKMLKTMA